MNLFRQCMLLAFILLFGLFTSHYTHANSQQFGYNLWQYDSVFDFQLVESNKAYGSRFVDFDRNPENIMLIGDVTAEAGDIITIEIKILNDEEFVGFNLDAPIPEGFTYIEGTAQLFREDDHMFVFNVLPSGVANIMGFSITNSAFIGNEGVIFSFEVQTPDVPGEYLFEIVDPVISNIEAQDILTGTIDGVETLTDTDNYFYALTLIAEPAEGGEVNGAGEYLAGDEVVVEAFANEGYEFVNWTDLDGELVSTQASFLFTMPDKDLTIFANFELTAYELTLITNPDEGGMVTGAGLYNFGEMVDVDAIPNEGWEFVVWTLGDGAFVSDEPFNTIMITGDLTLIANFEMTDYTLTVNVEGEGYVEIDPEKDFYNLGDEIQLFATPANGWEFINWTDEYDLVISEYPSFAFSMPAEDITLIANFEDIPENLFTLTFIVEDEVGFAIEDAEIVLGPIENEPGDYVFNDVPHGVHDFTITAEGYYTVEGELEVVDQDVTVTVTMEETGSQYYIITATSSGNGAIDPSGETEVTHGHDALFTITPNTGSYIDNVEINGASIGPVDTYTFVNVTEDGHTIHAIFAKHTYTLTLIANPAVGGTVNSGGEYEAGEEAIVEAMPNEGWQFVNWTDNDGNVLGSNTSFVFTMPAGDVTLTANFIFIDEEYFLTLIANPEEGGEAFGAGIYEAGDEVEVSATPNEGWDFINWTGDIAYIDDPDSETITVTMPASNVNLTAHFEEILQEITTLSQLHTAEPGVLVRFTGNAVIVALDDHRNRKFLQDGTAAIMIDDEPGVITTEYELYDVITDILGTINIHNQMIQFQPAANTPPATENTPVDPIAFGLNEATSDDQAKLIEFSHVRFVDIAYDQDFVNETNYTITDGMNEFVVRTDFTDVDYIGEKIPHTYLDIAGVILQHNTMLQIVPRFSDDFTTLFNLKLIADPAECSIILDGGGNYAEEESATVNAAECDDYSFVRWVNHYGQTVSHNREFTYDMPAHHVTLTAKFISKTTLVDATKPQNIIIYPNPFSSSITIKHSNGINNIKLVNIFGKTIKSFANPPGEYLVIATDGLNDGVYMLLFEYDGGYQTSKTIIKGQ